VLSLTYPYFEQHWLLKQVAFPALGPQTGELVDAAEETVDVEAATTMAACAVEFCESDGLATETWPDELALKAWGVVFVTEDNRVEFVVVDVLLTEVLYAELVPSVEVVEVAPKISVEEPEIDELCVELMLEALFVEVALGSLGVRLDAELEDNDTTLDVVSVTKVELL